MKRRREGLRGTERGKDRRLKRKRETCRERRGERHEARESETHGERAGGRGVLSIRGDHIIRSSLMINLGAERWPATHDRPRRRAPPFLFIRAG